MDKKIKKKEIEKKIQELTGLLQRTQADSENYRKQTEKRVQEIQKLANKDLILQLLPILDNFGLALKNTKTNQEDFTKGIELIYSQLLTILGNQGVKPIETENKGFDPSFHEALIKVASDKPENTIVEELQKGFTLNDKVIRCAKVKISAGDNKEVNRMKTIQEVRDEYTECPKGHSRKHFSFLNENVYCEKCDAHYGLGMKKYRK